MKIDELQKRLNEIDTQAIKKFGQNFLINQDLIEDLVSHIKKDSSSFIEIGPGLGSLTDHFETEKQNITLVEKDKKIAAYWEKRNFKVICKDALKMDWSQFQKDTIIFGNLPYQIAASLILELSCQSQTFSKMIFMMQKEVAERLLSQHDSKDYGILSVMAQTFWDIQSLGVAHQNDFHPRPKVKGQILQFHFKNQSLIKDQKAFLEFLKVGFSQRRKKFIKQLEKFVSTKQAEHLLSELNYDHHVRAEQIPIQKFIWLYNNLS